LRLQGGHIAAVALLASVFLLVDFLPLWHTDVWGHLKYGQWIVEHGSLPSHEPFCAFADKEAPYVNFQWLAQTGLYLVFHAGELIAGGDEVHCLAGGVEFLRALHALLIVLRSAFLLVALRRWTGSLPWAIAGIVLSLTLGIANVGVLRPQVLAEVLFAALLALLSKPHLSRPNVAVIVGILIVWANLHGSYPVGFMLLGAWLTGSIAERLLGWLKSPEAKSNSRRLLIALIASVAGVALLNPHGPALFSHTLALAGNPNIADMDEWKSISWETPWGVAFLASLLLLAVIPFLKWFAHRDRRAASPRLAPQLLLLLVFGLQTYFHQRMMVWWVLLVPWVLATWWGQKQPREGAATCGDEFEATHAPSLRPRLACALAMLVCALLSGPGQWVRNGEPRPLAQSLHAATPWQLAAQIKQEYAEGRWHGAVFASETQGDYLLWALPAEIPVFAYTHVHLFSLEHWRKCQCVKAGAPGWRTILNRYHVHLVVIEAELHSGLRRQLRGAPDWNIVLDEAGVRAKTDVRSRLLVAVRKESANSVSKKSESSKAD
jgi:hypothetical protein